MLAPQLAQEILRANQLIVEDPACDGEELCDQRVSHRIAHAVAVFATDDDLAGPEDAQLLRNDRLLETECLLQLLHAVLGADQPFEDSDAHRVREGLEKRRFEGLERAGCRGHSQRVRH
jgi:hypothetical protein